MNKKKNQKKDVKKKKTIRKKKNIRKKKINHNSILVNAILSIILFIIIIINLLSIPNPQHNQKRKNNFRNNTLTISIYINRSTDIVNNNIALLLTKIEEDKQLLEANKQEDETETTDETDNNEKTEKEKKNYSNNNQPTYQSNENNNSTYSTPTTEPDNGNNNYQEPANTTSYIYYQDIAIQVLDLVNQARAENNLQPLSWNGSLEQTAKTRAGEIINTFEHTRPDGQKWSTALNIGYTIAGENIAAGQSTAQSVVNSWLNSPSHKANIMNENFNQMGVALCYDPSSEYKYYWAQIFTN